MKRARPKVYLGDSVYVAFEHPFVVLTTEDGVSVTNRILLEPEVTVALVDWLKQTFGKNL